jgi:O-antigen/teichoic acid export membrane protein
MSIRVRLLRSLSARWLRLGADIVIGIFIAPFILHRLGDEAFGIYVLVFSVTGYFGLLDLGVGASLVRYVARFVARQEYEDLNRFLNTAFFTYCTAGSIALIGSMVLAVKVNSIFRVAPAMHHTAQLVFVIVGLAMGTGFPLGIFGGVLEGLQRFPTLDLSGICSAVARALLVVVVLTHGLGLIAVCLVTVGVRAIVPCFWAVLVFRAIPLKLRWRYVSWNSFKTMANFSIPAFVIGLGTSLFIYSDEAITGIFVSTVAVTYFSIAAKLSRYSTGLTDAIGDLFYPLSSHFDAIGDMEGLRKILIQGSQSCALTAFPFMVLFIVLGKPIIDVWVGSRYESSYTILLIMMVPFVLTRAQDPTRRIPYGMNRHRPLAVARMAEGITNVLLSVLLVHRYGLIGVALGTAIPMTLTAFFFYPPYLCRLLKVSIIRYWFQAYVPALLFCIPLTFVLEALKRQFPVPSYATLAIQGAIGGAVYGSLLLWFFLARDPLGIKVRNRLAEFVRQAITR